MEKTVATPIKKISTKETKITENEYRTKILEYMEDDIEFFNNEEINEMIKNAVINKVPLENMHDEIYKYLGSHGLLAYPK